jgi:Ca2+-binding RTX toxin-like protein
VHGGAGNDFIQWNDPTGDVAFGDKGDDTIVGGDLAADEIHGGAGDDRLVAFTTAAANATAGDTLIGDAGKDTLIGGDAGDRLDGGEGSDVLTGNGGADVFVFHALGAGDDRVTDFQGGVDQVELVGFGAGFDPLAHVHQTAEGVDLDLGAGGHVVLAGLTVAQLHASDFIFS